MHSITGVRVNIIRQIALRGGNGLPVGGSPVPRWWELPPAPTRVFLDPAASPPPMCDGSGAGAGFRGQFVVPSGVHAIATSLSLCVRTSTIGCVVSRLWSGALC